MLYKLTNGSGMTRGNTQWRENVTHRAEEEGNELCTGQVVHAYRDRYLAVFHDPIAGSYGDTALLWEARGRVVADDGLKVGCKSLTTRRQIPLPVITTEQRVEIAIRTSLLVYKETSYVAWAEGWLSGKDRTRDAARAARVAAESADRAARDAAERAARAAERAAAWDAACAAAWAKVSSAAIIKIIHAVVGRE